jgi:hypothetical protein
MLAIGGRLALAPVLDVTRDPRWGRIEETYGEDPYLATALGVAYVRGIQGPDLAEGVAELFGAEMYLVPGRIYGGLPPGGPSMIPDECTIRIDSPAGSREPIMIDIQNRNGWEYRVVEQ